MDLGQCKKMAKKQEKANRSEPRTEEECEKMSKKQEKANRCENRTEEENDHLPFLSEFLLQEQKELGILKNLDNRLKKEATTRDSVISKERMKLRLRVKLAKRQALKAKEREDKHTCTKDCEKRMEKRARKILAAKKKFEIAKSKALSEQEQQKNHDGMNQYRDPDKSNDDGEKEEESQNEESGEDNDNPDDGKELNAGINTLPQDKTYREISKEDQENMLKMQETMDYQGIDGARYVNPHLPSHSLDDIRHQYSKHEEANSDEDDDEELIGLQLQSLEISEEPKLSHEEKVLSGGEEENARSLLQPQERLSGASSSSREDAISNDFSKFLSYKYHF